MYFKQLSYVTKKKVYSKMYTKDKLTLRSFPYEYSVENTRFGRQPNTLEQETQSIDANPDIGLGLQPPPTPPRGPRGHAHL